MRGIISAVLAAVVCAATAQASFIYVEVPEPYTRQDYIDAVKGRGPGGDLLTLMKEDAYAQMRERNNPYVDYVIFPTKNGEVIRPDAEEAGVEAQVISQQVPWYNGVLVVGQGYWGEIMVFEKDRERAEKVIEGLDL